MVPSLQLRIRDLIDYLSKETIKYEGEIDNYRYLLETIGTKRTSAKARDMLINLINRAESNKKEYERAIDLLKKILC